MFDFSEDVHNLTNSIIFLASTYEKLQRKCAFLDESFIVLAHLSGLFIHPTFQDEGLKFLSIGHSDYNSVWRQADFDSFLQTMSAGELFRKTTFNL